MEDVVLPSPDVGAAAEQVEHAAHGAIHDARRRERAMVAVVADVEADAGERQSQGDAEQNHLPPVVGPGEQGSVGGAAPEQEQCRFEIDAPPAIAGPAQGSEPFLDARLHLLLEPPMGRERGLLFEHRTSLPLLRRRLGECVGACPGRHPGSQGCEIPGGSRDRGRLEIALKTGRRGEDGV